MMLHCSREAPASCSRGTLDLPRNGGGLAQLPRPQPRAAQASVSARRGGHLSCRAEAPHGGPSGGGTEYDVGASAGAWGRLCAGAAGAVLSAALLTATGPAVADTSTVAGVGSCLLSQCQGALARCLGDGPCLQNLVCLNACNGRPDEIACQLRCGDLYADPAIDTFNACAISSKKCVPQRADEGLFPVPPDCALDTSFDLNNFDGRWYISAGYNKMFDTFPCQEHFFAVPEPGKLYGKINWRIDTPNDWLQRETIQRFVQDPTNPAIMYNHDNEYLHYQDDWYVIASKPDEYVFIYYKGSNDAWDGYGGAVVYTRAAELPEEYIPELKVAAENVGLRWENFTITDNSCKPHPPRKSLLDLASEEGRMLEAVLEEDLRSFGKGFTVVGQGVQAVEGAIIKELTAEEELVARELREAGSLLRRIEKQYEPSFLSKLFPFLSQ